MSESNYIKHIAEASYKNVIKGKSNTDNNLAWYEEPETVSPKVDAKSIWLDAEYIPEEPQDASFRGNLYYKTINGSSVAIVEKFEKAIATKINERAVLFSPKLVDCIHNENYHLTIVDVNGDEIPFGLKKWTIDAGVGYLSFTDGFPTQYELPFYVSGYRYVGRKLPEHMITTDGRQTMLPDYEPTEDQSVATKSYVDKRIDGLNVDVERMLPPEPPTIEGKDLTFICADKFEATDIISKETYENVVLPHYEWTIDVPEFYNPGYGRFSMMVNTGSSWQEFAYIELGKVGKSVPQGFIIEYDGDAYANTLASRGFYNSIKCKITSTFDALSGIFKAHTAPMRFKAKWEYLGNTIYSNEITVCEEFEQEEFNHLDRASMVLGSNDMKYHYVSGIVTPDAGSHILMSGIKHNTLKKFTMGTHIENVTAMGLEYDHTPELPYTKYSPALELKESLLIPENYYNEMLTINAKTFDIFNNTNGEIEKEYKFRVDTISDESNRVKSGRELGKVIEGACLGWDASEDLRYNNELQLLGGVYQWPEKDFSINGQGNLADGTWNDISWLRTAHNYDECLKTGERFVTFKHDMSIANGVYISIDNPENLTQDKDTHAYKVNSMYIKVEGQTDWLDAKEPYDGIGVNKEWKQGCLAVQDSKDGKIYCTFGPKPLEGKLFVRIGIKYDSHTRFTGITIEENI